ncbi:hypothetical protein J3459_011024 [Metarhizium acridum]|nr:hypothetical protein J3459_011024 [Metarhizium acridum]
MAQGLTDVDSGLQWGAAATGTPALTRRLACVTSTGHARAGSEAAKRHSIQSNIFRALFDRQGVDTRQQAASCSSSFQQLALLSDSRCLLDADMLVLTSITAVLWVGKRKVFVSMVARILGIASQRTWMAVKKIFLVLLLVLSFFSRCE